MSDVSILTVLVLAVYVGIPLLVVMCATVPLATGLVRRGWSKWLAAAAVPIVATTLLLVVAISGVVRPDAAGRTLEPWYRACGVAAAAVFIAGLVFVLTTPKKSRRSAIAPHTVVVETLPPEHSGVPARAGWYPDPLDRWQWRFFDGQRWSETVAETTSSADTWAAPLPTSERPTLGAPPVLSTTTDREADRHDV